MTFFRREPPREKPSAPLEGVIRASVGRMDFLLGKMRDPKVKLDDLETYERSYAQCLLYLRRVGEREKFDVYVGLYDSFNEKRGGK